MTIRINKEVNISIRDLIRDEEESKNYFIKLIRLGDLSNNEIFKDLCKEFHQENLHKNNDLVYDFWNMIFTNLCNETESCFVDLLKDNFKEISYVDKDFIFFAVCEFTMLYRYSRNTTQKTEMYVDLICELFDIDKREYNFEKFQILEDFCSFMNVGEYYYPETVDSHIYIKKLMEHDKNNYDFLQKVDCYRCLSSFSSSPILEILLDFAKSINVHENMWEVDLLIMISKYVSPKDALRQRNQAEFILEIFEALVEGLDTTMSITEEIYKKFEEEFYKIDFKYDSLDLIKENNDKVIKDEVDHIIKMNNKYPNYNHN